jgi:hypothetical protein
MNKPAMVGHLLDVTGTVEIERAGRDRQKGGLLSPLETGDRLRVAAGGRAVVVLYANGARYDLAGPATARVENTRLQPLSGAPPRTRPPLSMAFIRELNHAPSPPDARLLAVRGLILRGGADELGPCRPEPDGAVRAGPITLRWTGPVHGEQLHLQIADGHRTVHAANLPPAAREYPVPAGVLQPGVSYVWFVTAVQDGESRQSCGALIRLLSPDELTALQEAEQQFGAAAGLAPATAPALLSPPELTDQDGSHAERVPALLLLGSLYERLGLLAEARRAFEQVQRLRPGDVGIAAALRRVNGAR